MAAPHLYKPLSFIERKTLSKLRLGILPIRIETARFSRPVIPEQERVCYCGSLEVESESHVLFNCKKYQNLRKIWLNSIFLQTDFRTLPLDTRFDIVLNRPENVKQTAKFIVSVMDQRSLLNDVY